MEGGFKGRTNKLVDGCYSFWQGSLSALIQTDIATHAENMHASESRTGESTVHRDIGNRKPWQQAQDLVTRARQAADAAQVLDTVNCHCMSMVLWPPDLRQFAGMLPCAPCLQLLAPGRR